MIINNNESDKCKAKKVRKNKRGTVDHDKLMKQRKVFVSKSLLPIYNYNYYKDIFIQQPLSDEYAVCAVICAGHIVNRQLSIEKLPINDGRFEFERIATTIPNSYNEHGHYHITVLELFLQTFHLKFHKVPLEGKQVDIRRMSLYNIISSYKNSTVFFFKASIILTVRSLKIAPNHYVVVKILNNSIVLLDGLFMKPKLFCMEILCRYTQIDSLYIVIPFK